MTPQVNITRSIGPSFAFPEGNIWRDANARARSLARFWANVNRAKAKAKDCWPWTGYVATHGYGVVGIGTKPQVRFRAHRLAWMLSRGPIPDGMVVCHRCDNPRCVNPAHLFLGSQAENIVDAVRKGRWGMQKLTVERVAALRHQYAQGGITQKELARQFGIARNTASQILSRKTWAHLPDVPVASDQVRAS